MKKLKMPFEGEIWNRMVCLIYPEKGYSLQEISKKWKEPPFIAEKYIEPAINSKVIIKKGIGRMMKYKLNKEDYKVKDMLKQLEEMKIKPSSFQKLNKKF
jgi:hypothetical protein